MSFSLNGNTFTPSSAFDHAVSMLTSMNNQLQSQSLPALSPNNANALWWTLLAQGDFDAQFDQLIMQAANSFNPALADDNQILNLLPIAGTSLYPATYSQLTLLFTATSGTLAVPSGTLVPYGTYNFATQTNLTVPASGSLSATSYCTTSGPITVPAGGINLSSLPGIVNLANVTNPYVAIAGQSQETVTSARNRIISGKTIGVGIDGCISALRSLPGLGQANVFMNLASSGNMALSGLAGGLPPRTAWIVVQNYHELIASTYLTYMTLPTSGAGFLPSNSQNYYTLSGQSFPVRFDYSGTQEVYAQVFIDSKQVIQNGYQTVLQNTITNLNGTYNIGQRVTSEQLSVQLYGFAPATVLGVLVSTASGGTYSQYADPNSNNIPYFTASGISVVLV